MMGKLLDALMPKAWPWVAVALAALVLVQQLRVERLHAQLANVEKVHAKTLQAQTQQALAATETKAGALLQHAETQQENTHDYTQKIAALETARADAAVRIERLQHDIRTAATAHAQAASDAAACADLRDRHQHLGTLAAEGAGVAGSLIGLVQQRDAQVDALRGQLLIDRQLLGALD